jgi:hypothetical protein
MAVTRIDTSALVDQSSVAWWLAAANAMVTKRDVLPRGNTGFARHDRAADPPTAIAFPPWSGKDRRHRTGGRVERLARRDDARHQLPEKSAQ